MESRLTGVGSRVVFRRDLFSALFSFFIYINDLDVDLTRKISKFADDTKIASRVISTLDKEFLQRDLDKLSNWARDWQMKFNVVMHIGINNDNAGVKLLVTNTETDFGVMISDDLKPRNQCTKVVKTASKLLYSLVVQLNINRKKLF